jgi:esterase/lipase superfamily enzyme
MHGHHQSWHSPNVGRQMHVRWFGHAGARVLVFPTTMGNHDEWPNRYMPDVLREQIERGWIQLFCLDHNHDLSWYNKQIRPHERARRHLQYDRYLRDELLPFTQHVNGNPFVIATGASFGGFHAMSFGLRHPEQVHRIIAMSGMFDISGMTGGYTDELVYACSPMAFMEHEWEPSRMAAFRRQDIIMAIGDGDPFIQENRDFSALLWRKGIGNALREWRGHAHDWPWWEQMIGKYIGGHD